MPAHRLLSLSPANDPVWVRLSVHEIEGVWAAMIAGTPGAGRGRAPERIPSVAATSCLPKAPAVRLGVITLRGQALSILDIRPHFGPSAAAPLPVHLSLSRLIAPDVADLRGMLSANRCQCHGMVYEIQRFRLGTRQVPRS
jgi:hypothetical protein